MPSLTTWAPFCPCGQCYPRDQNKHMAAPVKVARQQTTRELSGTFRTLPPTNPTSGTYTNTRRNSPEPSGTFQDLPNQPTPAYTGTLQNLPEPSGTCLRNRTYTILHRNSPEPSEPASGTYTSIRRNCPDPSGTRRNLHQHAPELLRTFRTRRNLHQHTPELSGTFRNPPLCGTFRNPPPEPTPAYTGTFRNLPEPSSGTCSCDPHRHTPELIWAEDPISSRCWEKTPKELRGVILFCFGRFAKRKTSSTGLTTTGTVPSSA